MINQGIDVPDKTIAMFMLRNSLGENFEEYTNNLKKPDKRRDWFTPHAYHCLPLVLGNQQGFILTANFSFDVMWNGGDKPEDMEITYRYPQEFNFDSLNFTQISKVFGNGIVTILVPYSLRTPPGVNILTINPPNHIIKNATVLTGTVETDNLRHQFTFNLKLHEPNVLTSFEAGTPLSAFIPIPRYFTDQFELKNARDIFTDEVVEEELDAFDKHQYDRFYQNNTPGAKPDRKYFSGIDPFGNKFLDHQKP
jgi:hypothetical protein